MIKPCRSRAFYLLELFIIMGLLGYAYYLETYQGLMPCLLCSVQRIIFATLGLLFFLAAIFRFKRFWLVTVNFFCSLIALAGLAFAGRQLWLQHFPPTEEGSCDASIGYLWDILPLSDFLSALALGGPECAKITWQFLGFSMAGWSFLWFGAFFLFALWQFIGWALNPKLSRSTIIR